MKPSDLGFLLVIACAALVSGCGGSTAPLHRSHAERVTPVVVAARPSRTPSGAGAHQLSKCPWRVDRHSNHQRRVFGR